jgi:HEAT repeat protein
MGKRFGRFACTALTCLPVVVSAPMVVAKTTVTQAQSADPFGDTLRQRCGRMWTGNFIKMAESQLPADHVVNNPELEVVLDVAFKGSGGFVEATVSTSSGVPEFDSGALEVVRDVASVKLQPPDVASDDGNVHVRWVFARKDGRCDSFSAYEARLPVEGAVVSLTKNGREAVALERLSESATPAAVQNFSRTWLERQKVQQTSHGAKSPCDKVLPALSASNSAEREKAIAALFGAMDEKCVAPLVTIANNNAEKMPLRVSALRALGSIESAVAVDALKKNLESTTPAMLAVAIEGWSRPERGRKVLFALTPFLKHVSPPVRRAAAAGLVRAAGDAAISQLFLLWKEKTPEAFEGVAVELGRLSSSESADFLGKMLKRDDIRVRIAAALALAGRSDAAAKALLVGAKSDANVRIRAAAASAGDEATVTAVVEELKKSPSDAAWVQETMLTGSGRAIAARLFAASFLAADVKGRKALALRWASPPVPVMQMAVR